jgi:hypothetical protein
MGFLKSCSMIQRLVLVSIIISAQLFFAQKPKKLGVLVEGEVTQTSQYCGGARPPQELLKRLATPSPLANQKLYIRSGLVNELRIPVLDSVVTDKKGNFKIKLPKGDYCIVNRQKKDVETFNEYLEKYRIETETYGVIDKDCYSDFVQQPDGFLTIKGTEKKAIKWKIHYENPCEYNANRCVQYKGKLPQ